MPRRARKQKKRASQPIQEEEEDGWWSVRGILDERKLKGKTEYLVDWDDNPKTGEPYPSSWTQWVSPDIIKDWKKQKAKEKRTSNPPSAAPPSDESDQDIRPSNWRRNLKRTHESPLSRPGSTSPSPKEPPKKKERLATLERTSEEPASSIISADTRESESQPPPVALHLEQFSRLGGHRLAIELKPPEFDTSDYQSITNTQGSSQLVSELEEADHRTILSSDLSQRTIPDSQDHSCSVLAQSLPIAPVESLNTNSQTAPPSRPATSSSLFVPDSPDQPSNCQVSTPAEQTVNSAPANQDASNCLQPAKVLNSEAPPLEIPSHQPEPERSQLLSLESPDLSTGELVLQSTESLPRASTCGAPGLPSSAERSIPRASTSGLECSTPAEPLVPRAPEAGISQNSASGSAHRESLFLTQPHLSLESPAVTSSLPDSLAAQPLGGPGSTRFEIPSSTNRSYRPEKPNNPQPSFGESQAAQIVARDFEASPDEIPDSNSTGRNITSLSGTASEPPFSRTETPRHRIRPSRFSPGPNFPTSSVAPSPEIVDELLSGSRNKDTSVNMEESSSSSRPSAADELKSLFDFGGAMLPADLDVDTDPLPQDGAESLPDGSAPAGSTPLPTPDIAVRSLSQPASLEPWKPEVLGNTDHGMPPPSISPASIMPNPNISPADALKNIVDMTFGGSSLLTDTSGPPPGTISPADISCSVGPGEASHTLMMPLSDQAVIASGFDESPVQSITMGQGTQPDYEGSSASSQEDVGPSEHVVTLPFQASRRPYYDDTLVEYKAEAESFGEIFNSEVYKEPDEGLVQRIDELLGRLFNICDYPQDLVGTRLEDLPLVQQAKYANDANPKFNFMYELLQTIQHDTDILVLARTPELLRLLYAETEALELESVCHGFEKPNGTYRTSAARVTLALSSEDFDPFKFHVVIGFDHTFSHSPVSRRLTSGNGKEKAPLVLQLVTTHSIEHILLHIPQDLSPLEKKNALLSGIVQARSLIEDPEPGYNEPHQAAITFAGYLNGTTEGISWEPQSIPDNVIDFFLNTQSLSQALEESRLVKGNGLKRKLDTEEDPEVAKRMRVLPVLEPILDSHDPPLPYPMRELLNSARPKGQAKTRMSKISIPLAVLEVLTEQVAEYKRQAASNALETQYKAVIDRLEKQVKEYQRTTKKVERSHREALQDRSTFEKAKLKAEEATKAAAEAAQKDADKRLKRISELEAVVARLTVTPDDEESPLSRTEKLLEEAQKKITTLKKRLENSQREANYIRDVYQDVNTKSGVMAAEMNTLRKENEDLEQKASANLKQIHQMQADATKEAHLHHIAELKTLVREQEYELGRLCEERSLRNGRPSTRQASVPRSPRTGMMSPRTGRGFGGSASRGTSPAAMPGHDGSGGGGGGSGGISGVQFMGQQPGNGRWGHLRD